MLCNVMVHRPELTGDMVIVDIGNWSHSAHRVWLLAEPLVRVRPRRGTFGADAEPPKLEADVVQYLSEGTTLCLLRRCGLRHMASVSRKEE